MRCDADDDDDDGVAFVVVVVIVIVVAAVDVIDVVIVDIEMVVVEKAFGSLKCLTDWKQNTPQASQEGTNVKVKKLKKEQNSEQQEEGLCRRNG